GDVIGVLAGHLHDSHKEIYHAPYEWSEQAGRSRVGKLFVSPPLSVRDQANSPIQARGFSLLRLTGDELDARLFWYDSESGTFAPEPIATPGLQSARPGGVPRLRDLPGRVGAWLSSLPDRLWRLPSDKFGLERATVFAIAILLAFLTVVEVWKIPPKPDSADGEGDTAANQTAGPAQGSAAGSPFLSNFAKTVWAGLGGLAGIALIEDAFFEAAGFNAKSLYLVLFVVFFLSLLLLSAFLRGTAEALRGRIAAGRRPPAMGPKGNPLSYWAARFWVWVKSWREPALIFFDAAFNVVQGKNELRSVVWDERIRALHWSLLRTAQQLRETIDWHVRAAVKQANGQQQLHERDIRVNITLRSADEKRLFYIAWAGGSLARGFTERSVAYVAVESGEARWWKLAYSRTRLTSLQLTEEGTGKPAEAMTLLNALKVKQTDESVNNGDKLLVVGKRADGTDVTVSLRVDTGLTVSYLLERISSDSGFGPAAEVDIKDGMLVIEVEPKNDELAAELKIEKPNAAVALIGKFAKRKPDAIVLFENSDQEFPDVEGPLKLKEYYMVRPGRDYEAFVVLPVPWLRRGFGKDHRSAGIHISFKKAQYMDSIWPELDRVDGSPDYGRAKFLLDEKSMAPTKELAAVLNQSVKILAEVVQHFNDVVFTDHIRPRIPR
ncbi:MAG: hypothetical protein HKM89_15110, partial [Gemmatimonadales bacterium]|nr:hypothetical protein [Gemmatimonadales bacterium]